MVFLWLHSFWILESQLLEVYFLLFCIFSFLSLGSVCVVWKNLVSQELAIAETEEEFNCMRALLARMYFDVSRFSFLILDSFTYKELRQHRYDL